MMPLLPMVRMLRTKRLLDPVEVRVRVMVMEVRVRVMEVRVARPLRARKEGEVERGRWRGDTEENEGNSMWRSRGV